MELNNSLSSNGDNLTITRIVCSTLCAFHNIKGSEPDHCNVPICGKLFFNCVNVGIQSLSRVILGHTTFFCHCGNQFGLVHSDFFYGLILFLRLQNYTFFP